MKPKRVMTRKVGGEKERRRMPKMMMATRLKKNCATLGWRSQDKKGLQTILRLMSLTVQGRMRRQRENLTIQRRRGPSKVAA